MKRKIIKLFLFFIVFALVFSSLPVNASSNEKSSEKREIIFKEKEITDQKVLYEKAKKEKKSNKKDKNKDLLGALLESDNGEVELEVLSTSQLIEVAQVEGGIEEVYVGSYFADLSESDFDLVDGEFSAASVQNSAGTHNDTRGYAVRGYGRVNYTITVRNDGRRAAKLNFVQGSWTMLDSSFYLSNRSYEYGNNGILNNGDFSKQHSGTRYTTSNSFTAYPPTSWVAVDMNGAWSCGVKATATITRSSGGSSYQFTFHQNVANYN